MQLLLRNRTTTPHVVCVVSVRNLTDVNSLAVALHKQQNKDVERDEVDDEHVSSPRRHLQNKQAHAKLSSRAFQLMSRFAVRDSCGGGTVGVSLIRLQWWSQSHGVGGIKRHGL